MDLRLRKDNVFKKALSAKPGTKSKSSMNDLIECPVCMTYMFPPIHQCCNGHTICFKCKSRVKNICPICRKELGNIRCLALEKVAERLDLPCKFHVFGCQCIFSYHKVLEHEKICRFRPYNCLHNSNCSVTGDIKSLVAHLKKVHSTESFDVVDGSTFTSTFRISTCNAKKWRSALYNCFGHQFCMHGEAFTIANAPVFMAFLHFMGEPTDARKFRYCLEVGGNERKMVWQGIPRSIRDNYNTIRDSHDGLIIQKKSIALFFSGDRQESKLKVVWRIWRANVI